MPQKQYLLKPDLETAKIFSDRTRLRIVELLKEREMTNTLLAKELGISKATVTHHMKILEEAGVVRIARVEETRGIPKKYYTLVTGFLESEDEDISKPVMEEMVKEFRKLFANKKFRKQLGDEVNIAFLKLYKSAFLSARVDLDDVLYDLGYELGRRVFAEMVEGETLEEVLRSLAGVWQELELGRVEIEEAGEDSAEIVVRDCYQCMHMPNVGKPLCATDEGMIAGVLAGRLGGEFRVREVECWGTGREYCRFEISREEVPN
ncbi:MAG: ArsR family transcriptional regulator [Euryarchaeota archaeon]|nr:ArsR family transcriptional regulator [Euryarchaeota archaeon]